MPGFDLGAYLANMTFGTDAYLSDGSEFPTEPMGSKPADEG